ncbi:MAG: penicillin-binding protein 2 [Christensenellaceae bacterium]|nr:penicillin-binding protein 2 [Christensenellaceae bacterium]
MKNIKKFRRNMRIALGIFSALFSLLIIYLGYSVIAYGEKWFATPYNPRVQSAVETIEAGTIYDRYGEKLAWSDEDGRHYSARRDIRRATSHVVGDIHGKSVGAETVFAKYLYGMDKDMLERLQEAAAGQEKRGSDITLTIDSQLSEYIYDNMDAMTGSVVVLNYKTGEIVASVSIPTFDPKTVGEEEPKDTALVDRATMGRYPPGSIMKIVTASAAVEEGIDLRYTCTGEDIIRGQKVTCVKDHGEQTLKEAFANSCNTYFANLSVKLGGRRLLRQAEKFGFNEKFGFKDVNLYTSSFEISAEEGDVAWAGIGQYNDLITPMHAAMMAATIANDGVMMQPKLLSSVAAGGYSAYELRPTVFRKVLEPEDAKVIKDYMFEVVESGTGTSAGVKNARICGKTGTAEFVEDGEVKNHSWFVGFVDDPENPYAISVIFEGAGYGSRYAAPMAGKVLRKLIS